MEFSYQVWKDDLIKFNDFHISNNKAKRIFDFVLIFVVFIGFILPASILLLLLGELFTGVFLLIFTIVFISTYKKFNKFINDKVISHTIKGNITMFLGKRNFIFEGDSFTISSEQMTTNYKISAMYKLAETDDLLILYLSKNLGLVFPKRYLSDALKNQLIFSLKAHNPNL